MRVPTIRRRLFTKLGPIRSVVALAVLHLVLAVPRAAQSESEARPFGVVDLHVDLPYQSMFEGRSLARGTGQYDARWLREAGVEGVVFPLFVPRDVAAGGPQMKHLEASYQALEQKLPGIAPYAAPTTAPGCGAAKAGQVEAFYAFEGAAPLGRDLDSVFRWAKRGLRLFGLVHSQDNLLATSAGYGFTPARKNQGLTPLGSELVRRVHAAGAIVDVSHASDAAFADIMLQARRDAVPVVASHSNARALANHTRNLADHQLRAIADSGGVVGINFHSPFLLGGPGIADLDDVVRHIRHVARVAGIEAVAIGSDFEGGIRPPKELTTIRGFPQLARALLDDGFDENEVRKIFGENARRVLCRTAH